MIRRILLGIVWYSFACFLGMLAVTLAGCSLSAAQRTTQTTINSAAETVNTTSAAIVSLIPEKRAEARNYALETCVNCTVVQFMEVYDTKMAPIDRAIDGLEVVHTSLDLSQTVQDAWTASGVLPDTGPLCKALGDGVGKLPPLLDECGVENIPTEALKVLPLGVTSLCSMFSRWAQKGKGN